MHRHSKLPKPFEDLGVEVRFLKALAKMGFEEPSQIQAALIPKAFQNRDILGQARTGTGKTAAFGLPVLQNLRPSERLQALCLVPTRELAVQVTAELQRLAEFTELRIVSVYGGEKISKQLHQLGKKPHMVVGTPGRVMDFMKRGKLPIADVKFAILDEVDRMLDIGFRDDIRYILGHITAEHQTIFVSATIDDEIKRLAGRFMNDPLELNVSQDRLAVEEVEQWYVTAGPHDKWKALKLLLKQEDPPICIIFCNTKASVRKLTKRLQDIGYNAKGILGDLIQQKRDRVMKSFRQHRIRALVATDLASRGIDVSAITHIINYDIPPDPQVYVHRIGRTARMGEKGVAITFVTPEEGKELTAIEMLINQEITQKKLDGFEATEPQRPQEQPAEESRPRLHEPVAGGVPEEGKRPPPKTLGSKFKPKRRRRL